jgi:hypothetical protein
LEQQGLEADWQQLDLLNGFMEVNGADQLVELPLQLMYCRLPDL